MDVDYCLCYQCLTDCNHFSDYLLGISVGLVCCPFLMLPAQGLLCFEGIFERGNMDNFIRNALYNSHDGGDDAPMARTIKSLYCVRTNILLGHLCCYSVTCCNSFSFSGYYCHPELSFEHSLNHDDSGNFLPCVRSILFWFLFCTVRCTPKEQTHPVIVQLSDPMYHRDQT